jgi:streptogramin lyase
MRRFVAVLSLSLAAFLQGACGSNNNPSSPSGGSSPAPVSFSLSFTFGDHGAGNGQFHNVQGIAVYRGAVFVGDLLNNRVEKFDLNGYYQASYTINQPIGVVFDSAGMMYVASQSNNTITVVDQNLNLVRTFGSAGTGVGQFSQPQGLSIDSQSRVYVADYANNRIQRCSNTGTGCVTLGGPAAGTANGQFSNPFGLFVDANGNVWVADSGNNRIQEFDSSLSFIQKWGGTAPSTVLGQFDAPNDIRIDRDGNVIVADYSNHRIQVLTPSGTFLRLLGGGFGTPNYLAFDPSGNLYITDNFNGGGTDLVEVYAPH